MLAPITGCQVREPDPASGRRFLQPQPPTTHPPPVCTRALPQQSQMPAAQTPHNPPTEPLYAPGRCRNRQLFWGSCRNPQSDPTTHAPAAATTHAPAAAKPPGLTPRNQPLCIPGRCCISWGPAFGELLPPPSDPQCTRCPAQPKTELPRSIHPPPAGFPVFSGRCCTSCFSGSSSRGSRWRAWGCTLGRSSPT